MNPQTINRIRSELSQQNLVEGQPLRDVKSIGIERIRYQETVVFWREFQNIKFYKSPTVTKAVDNILKTVLPDVGVTYGAIIDKFLHAEWPIAIYLHGGLLRDILTSTVGNDVDITFTCSHHEMKQICDKNGWKSKVGDNLPYWAVGGEIEFETKLEGMSLSFNGLAKYQVSDFAANTIYYDCKNKILIDRYGTGVDAALAHKISLSVYSVDEWEEWRNADFYVGSKLFRYYKFVMRGFDYDIDEARFVQESLQTFLRDDLPNAIQSCFRCVRPLAREQTSRGEALKYKAKMKKTVKLVYQKTTSNSTESEAEEFWMQYWEPLIYGVMARGKYEDDESSPLLPVMDEKLSLEKISKLVVA